MNRKSIRPKTRRAKIRESDKLKIALSSGRRCTLCYGLERDTGVKWGHVAHVDRDPSNSDFGNLVFLCPNHHAEYDSCSHHSQRITPEEVKHYRRELYEYIESDNRSWRSPATSMEGKDDNSLKGLSAELDLFRLVNPESPIGFEVLAVDKRRILCFEFSTATIALARVYSEINQCLNVDYIKSSRTVSFGADELVELVTSTYFETDFSCIYSREPNGSISLVLVFGHGESYYEIDYIFDKTCVTKGKNKMDLSFHEEETNILRIRDLLEQLYKDIENVSLEWAESTQVP